MIILTEKAIEKAKEIAASEEIERPNLRVKVIGGKCAGLQYDMYFDDIPPTDFDEIFENDGIQIICDPLSFQYLNGVEIEWVDNITSQGFKFNNPNISRSCGCGASFSVD